MYKKPCASTVTYLFTRWKGYIQALLSVLSAIHCVFPEAIKLVSPVDSVSFVAACCNLHQSDLFLRRDWGGGCQNYSEPFSFLGKCQCLPLYKSLSPRPQSHYSPLLAPQYAPEDVILHAHGPVHAQDPTGTLITHKDWVCISGV